MRSIIALAVLSACGRFGFEPSGPSTDDASSTTGDGALDDSGAVMGDGATTDAPPPTIACADVNLGSALGPSVSSGSTLNAGNDYAACSGDGPELTFGWFAPATGMFRFDLCGSEQTWDSVMYIRDATCNGTQLACVDDSCGGAPGLQPRITLSLTAGQGIVIVVDSQFPDGNYQLAITQL